MNISLLPAFALVGLPASESDNVLVTPLAGHEIGHSVWLFHDLKGQFEEALAVAIDETMVALATETERLTEALRMGELGRQSIRQTCLHYGMLQLEEIFCDTVGAYSFGPSFLYAFEYFLAPGGNIRSLDYPSDLDRIRYIKHAADELHLEYDDRAFQGWTQSADNQHAQKELVVLLDTAVAKVAPAVINRAAALLNEKGVKVPQTEAISRILAAFGRTEPDCDGGTLAEIVTAGWVFVRDKGGLAAVGEEGQFAILSDLMLKSVEVAEFLQRVSSDA